MRILYVAVNYRTPRHAEAFVRCLQRDPVDARLVLVDNSEPDARVPLAGAPVMSAVVHYEAAPGNLGYFGGVRYGIARPVARSFDADWIVISNVDLTFDPTQVREVLSQHETATTGVIAPSITSTDSREEFNPFMASRPSRAKMRTYKYIYRFYFSFALYSWAAATIRRRVWAHSSSVADGASRQIYAPHGAIMIFSREFFSRGGSLEHPPFLFGEEITVAEQARRLSLPVVYCPRIRVTHQQHASVSRLPSRRRRAFVYEAAAYTADTYFP